MSQIDYRPRELEALLKRSVRQYPVVTLTGPRQSGKTTLARAAFPAKSYVSLEPLDQRDYATSDPRGFLTEYGDGAIIDEVQHAPALAGYIQEIVDQDARPGRFILTGSQHFGLTQTVTQSLAGRTAMLTLLPLSLDERRAFGASAEDLFAVMFEGGFPRIHARGLPPQRWLADYVATYVERDVRQLSNIGDLAAFTQFLKLCAARTAQEINLSALGGDAGVSHNTARAWLSVLEASYLVLRAPAWHRNLRKQLVKAPKLHFVDAGLACHLLGIRSAEELRHHPLRGALFESWVASEIGKHRLHRGAEMSILHYRESRGVEVDILILEGSELLACEVKSAATIQAEFLSPLRTFAERMRGLSKPPRTRLRVLYGGEAGQKRKDVEVIGWREIQDKSWLAG